MPANGTEYTEPANLFEYRLVIGWLCFVIVVVGVVGNIGTVIVMCTKPWRGTALAVILTALSISDLLILLSTPLTSFIGIVYDIDVSDQSDASCKLFVFLLSATQMTSAWLLVVVVMERMLNGIVTNDNISRWTQRPLVAIVVVIIIWVICYAVNTHLLVFFGLYPRDTTPKFCVIGNSRDYARFHTKQLPWFELFISYFVPYSMAFFGSIMVLAKGTRIQQAYARVEATSTYLSLSTRAFRIPLMILSVTSSLTVGPQFVYILYWFAYNYSPTNDRFYDFFIFEVLAALAQTNAAVKFYACVASDAEFRGSLLALFGRKRRAAPSLERRDLQGNDMKTFNIGSPM